MTRNKVQQHHSTKRFSQWSSLYNNIHPSRRLPSLSTLFIMIWGIMITGGQTISNDSPSKSLTKLEEVRSLNPVNSLTVAKFLNSGNKIQSQKTALKAFPKFTQKKPLLKALRSVENNNSDITEIKNEATDNQKSKVGIPVSGLFYPMKIDNQTNSENSIGNKKESEENVHFEIYATPSLLNQTGLTFGQNDVEDATSGMHADQNQKPFHLYKTREIEAGGALLFDISNSFRLKAGMQFSFANYTLEQNNYLISTQTFNTNNSIKNNRNTLTNAVYQLSIPLGTEWKLVGNRWIDWFAGATVQPSLILSDPSFFQKDDDLMNADGNAVFRKWNVHSTVETFVNYHLTKNTSLKLGPQLRYQLMPSLLPTYNVTERLYNVGLKLGLTGNF